MKPYRKGTKKILMVNVEKVIGNIKEVMIINGISECEIKIQTEQIRNDLRRQ